MGKSRVIQLALMLFSTIILLVVATFAWFATIEKTDPIIITTGSLKIESCLYKGIDSNFDGILDDRDEQYVEITEAGFDFPNVTPGQIYTFKFEFTNTGNIDGILDVYSNNIVDENQILDYFIVEEKLFYSPIGGNEIEYEDPGDLKNLLTSYPLDAQTSLRFIFQLRISDNLANSSKLKSLIINHFIVKLEQAKRTSN